MRKRALPNTAAGDEREKKSLQHEVSQALKEVQEEFLNIAQQAGSACKLVDVDVLLQDVVKSAGGAELQPHEAAADRKLLNAALTRAVGSLHSALSVKPTLAALKTKMRAVADAAPVSADVRCTYAEALADALRDVKPDAPGAGETAALKYLQKKGGGGGGGGEEELEITEGTGDTQARFKCPISQAPMKLPMKNSTCGHVYDNASILLSLKGKSDIDCPILGCGKKVTWSTLAADEVLQVQIETHERRKRKLQEEEVEAEKLTQRGRSKRPAVVEEAEEEEEG